MPKVCAGSFPLLLDSESAKPRSPDRADPANEPAPVSLGREAFQEAVTPLVPRLYRLCLALTGAPDQAEDLLQASLIKAYLRRDSFAGRGALAGWLATIVRNEHQESVRRVARRRSLLQTARACIEDVLDNLRAATPPDPESWVCSRQEAGLLLGCVHELPEPYRTIIWLCDVEELGYDEVSGMLGIPIGTVKSRHARGRARLRRALERQALKHGGGPHG